MSLDVQHIDQICLNRLLVLVMFTHLHVYVLVDSCQLWQSNLRPPQPGARSLHEGESRYTCTELQRPLNSPPAWVIYALLNSQRGFRYIRS